MIDLARDIPSHGRGHRFNPYCAHHFFCHSRHINSAYAVRVVGGAQVSRRYHSGFSPGWSDRKQRRGRAADEGDRTWLALA